ncbi:MAG: RDD family protein [Myxococcota bacterium]
MLPTLPFALGAVVTYLALRDTFRGPGRSLGRSMAGQRLMSVDGAPVTPGRAIGRNLVRFLLWITVLPALIDLFIFLFGDGRLIADHIFDTRVYEEPDKVAEERALNAQREDVSSRERFTHDALEHARFENNDYDSRQLEDFDSRLAASKPIREEDASSDDEEALRDFEARLSEGVGEVMEEVHEEVHEEQTVTTRR